MTLARSPVPLVHPPSAAGDPVHLPQLPGQSGVTHADPLHPAYAPRLRTDGGILLGADPFHGVVLTGFAAGECIAVLKVLHLLARATDAVSIETLAGLSGLAPTRVRQVVESIQAAGLTAADRGDVSWPGECLGPWSLARRPTGPERSILPGRRTDLTERRAGARVIIDGRGRLVEAVGQLLHRAQVGTVRTGWYAGVSEDLDAESPDPTVIVTIGRRPPRARAADWRGRGIPVLPVVAHPGSVDIGPFVVTGNGPCLECVGLGQGPGLLSDLTPSDSVGDGQGDLTVVEPTLAGLAAGAIAMLTVGIVDAYPPPLGIRWHTALPLPSLATSRWEIDPDCTWADHPGGTARRAEGVSGAGRARADETMTR